MALTRVTRGGRFLLSPRSNRFFWRGFNSPELLTNLRFQIVERAIAPQVRGSTCVLTRPSSFCTTSRQVLVVARFRPRSLTPPRCPVAAAVARVFLHGGPRHAALRPHGGQPAVQAGALDRRRRHARSMAGRKNRVSASRPSRLSCDRLIGTRESRSEDRTCLLWKKGRCSSRFLQRVCHVTFEPCVTEKSTSAVAQSLTAGDAPSSCLLEAEQRVVKARRLLLFVGFLSSSALHPCRLRSRVE